MLVFVLGLVIGLLLGLAVGIALQRGRMRAQGGFAQRRPPSGASRAAPGPDNSP